MHRMGRLRPGRGGDLHVGPAELPSAGCRLVEGGEAVQEPPEAVHLSAVRFLHRCGEGGEDVGAGHRRGRAGEQAGDQRQHVVPGDAALCLGPWERTGSRLRSGRETVAAMPMTETETFSGSAAGSRLSACQWRTCSKASSS